MFLFDPTFGSSFESCDAEVRRLMERAEAEVILCRKWDERRLAYRIKGRKRGVYVLVYFKASPSKIIPLERDAHLSENILRLLVLRADGVSLAEMEAAAVDDTRRPVDEREEKPSAERRHEEDEKRKPIATASDAGDAAVEIGTKMAEGSVGDAVTEESTLTEQERAARQSI